MVPSLPFSLPTYQHVMEVNPMSVHIALAFSIRLVCNIPPWTSIIFTMSNVYFHCNITKRCFRDLALFHYTQFTSTAQSCPTLCDPVNTTLPQKHVFLVLLCEYSILLLLLLLLLLPLLSDFSRVRLCATPQMAAHQAPLSLGFSRQEYWRGLPFSSPMHESEKWKWSLSVVPDSQRPHGLQPIRPLRAWDFPGKSTGVGCHRLLW